MWVSITTTIILTCIWKGEEGTPQTPVEILLHFSDEFENLEKTSTEIALLLHKYQFKFGLVCVSVNCSVQMH